MSYTLLQMVNQVQDELGLTRSSSVIGNTDQQVRQLLAYANKVGRDLVRDFEWRRLIIENIFETTGSRPQTAQVSSANTRTGFSGGSASNLCATGDVVSGTGIPQWAEVTIVTETKITLNVSCTGSASSSNLCTFSRQYYDLPSDFDRQVPRSQWDRSDHRAMYGQKSPQQWQWLKGGIVTAAPFYKYRLVGSRMKITPVPTTKLILANEYISNLWISVSAAANPTLSSYAADANLSVFNDDVMVNGIKFQFQKQNGLEYAGTLAEFNRSLSYSKGQDTPAENLSLAPEAPSLLLTTLNLPDGNIGL
mgnify:FL=1